jgi:hypothetical protein
MLELPLKLTVLHTFTGAPDGANPEAGVFRDTAGNLYGTTRAGGTGIALPDHRLREIRKRVADQESPSAPASKTIPFTPPAVAG